MLAALHGQERGGRGMMLTPGALRACKISDAISSESNVDPVSEQGVTGAARARVRACASSYLRREGDAPDRSALARFRAGGGSAAANSVSLCGRLRDSRPSMAATSHSGTAREKRKPCPSSAPRWRRRWSCPCVSIPSARTVMLSFWPSETIASSSVSLRALALDGLTNDRSTLMMLGRKRAR